MPEFPAILFRENLAKIIRCKWTSRPVNSQQNLSRVKFFEKLFREEKSGSAGRSGRTPRIRHIAMRKCPTAKRRFAVATPRLARPRSSKSPGSNTLGSQGSGGEKQGTGETPGAGGIASRACFGTPKSAPANVTRHALSRPRPAPSKKL